MTVAQLMAIMQCDAPRAARFHAGLVQAMAKYEIGTTLRQAHFLAQVGHETGRLRWTEELADGKSYEGRGDLGNTEPGDGPRFKGRGLIQLTGRKNYQDFAKACAVDIMSNPRMLATDHVLAADCAGWFWSTRGLNGLADKDDVRGITRKINGGENGLAERKAILGMAKTILKGAL